MEEDDDTVDGVPCDATPLEGPSLVTEEPQHTTTTTTATPCSPHANTSHGGEASSLASKPKALESHEVEAEADIHKTKDSQQLAVKRAPWSRIRRPWRATNPKPKPASAPCLPDTSQPSQQATLNSPHTPYVVDTSHPSQQATLNSPLAPYVDTSLPSQHILTGSRSPGRVVFWSVKAQHFLLARVKEHPILWDHGHDQFSLKTVKRPVWGMIVARMCQEFPELATVGLSEDDALAKFSKMKSSFQREVRRKLQHPQDGMHGNWNSKWEFFHNCSYMLAQYLEQLPTSSDILPPSSQTQEFAHMVVKGEPRRTVEDPCDPFGGDSDDLPPTSNLLLQPPPPTPSPTPSLSSVSTSTAPPLSSASSTPCGRGKRKRVPSPTPSGTDKFINHTMNRINNILGVHERSASDIGTKTADFVKGFMSMLTEPKKRRLSVKIINVLQQEDVTEDDLIS